MKQRVEEVMAVFLLPIEDNLSTYASCLFDNVLLGIVMRNYYAAEVIPLNSLMVICSWLYDVRYIKSLLYIKYILSIFHIHMWAATIRTCPLRRHTICRKDEVTL